MEKKKIIVTIIGVIMLIGGICWALSDAGVF